MQISQSETFKKEYKQITDFINQTDSEKKKTEVQSLLKELVGYVKKMDTMHLDLVNIGKLSDDSGDLRNKIVETRKKIFKIIGN